MRHARYSSARQQSENALQASQLIATLTCIQVLGLPSPRLIYVESFARVKKLSLSGKILYRLVDRYAQTLPVMHAVLTRKLYASFLWRRFAVQWEELASVYDKADCRGWLV